MPNTAPATNPTPKRQPERAWTTKPSRGPRKAIPCSPHLYRDCIVLKKRHELYLDPKLYEHEVDEFLLDDTVMSNATGTVTRILSRWAHLELKGCRTKGSVCRHCLKRAQEEDPDWIEHAGKKGPKTKVAKGSNIVKNQTITGSGINITASSTSTATNTVSYGSLSFGSSTGLQVNGSMMITDGKGQVITTARELREALTQQAQKQVAKDKKRRRKRKKRNRRKKTGRR